MSPSCTSEIKSPSLVPAVYTGMQYVFNETFIKLVLVSESEPFAFVATRVTEYKPGEENFSCGFCELAVVPFKNTTVFGLKLHAQDVGKLAD